MVFELVEFEICQSHQASERQQLNPLLVLDLSRKTKSVYWVQVTCRNMHNYRQGERKEQLGKLPLHQYLLGSVLVHVSTHLFIQQNIDYYKMF